MWGSFKWIVQFLRRRKIELAVTEQSLNTTPTSHPVTVRSTVGERITHKLEQCQHAIVTSIRRKKITHSQTPCSLLVLLRKINIHPNANQDHCRGGQDPEDSAKP